MEQVVTAGNILLSDPFLKDPNFVRTAILVCEHDDKGSFGFVINKPSDYSLGSLVPSVDFSNFPVFIGGPVQNDTLHFIHSIPKEIGGFEIEDGVFWGGNFEMVITMLQQQTLQYHQIKFFMGYSGWGSNQLHTEVLEKSWIVTKGNQQLVLATPPDLIWKNALRKMDGEYSLMINYPLDPQLN
ncbi:MAG: YqgE/AlgH family protein [Chitinophagaceae bacterium]